MTDLQRRVEELLASHDPQTTAPADFLGAQFDAGLAWVHLSLIHISEPTRRLRGSRMPSSA